MPAYANIYADQGTDFETILEVEYTSGDPIDLTNISTSGQARRSYYSNTAYDFETQIIDAVEGKLLVSIPRETTGSMNIGRYVYDVFAYDTVNDIKFKLVQGILEIIPQVTKDL